MSRRKYAILHIVFALVLLICWLIPPRWVWGQTASDPPLYDAEERRVLLEEYLRGSVEGLEALVVFDVVFDDGSSTTPESPFRLEWVPNHPQGISSVRPSQGYKIWVNAVFLGNAGNAYLKLAATNEVCHLQSGHPVDVELRTPAQKAAASGCGCDFMGLSRCTDAFLDIARYHGLTHFLALERDEVTELVRNHFGSFRRKPRR